MTNQRCSGIAGSCSDDTIAVHGVDGLQHIHRTSADIADEDEHRKKGHADTNPGIAKGIVAAMKKGRLLSVRLQSECVTPFVR